MFVMVLIENILFFGLENFIASLVLFLGWVLLKTFVFTSYNLKNHPVSFIMLLGLSFFHYVLPIPLTLLEFKPVTYNLVVPYLTFLHHFLFVLIITITHKIYANISQNKNIFRSILLKTDFYKTPSNRQIWITGILGLIFSFYIYFIFGQWQSERSERGFVFYVANIFQAYIWMPLIIPFSKYRFENVSENIYSKNKLILYSFLVFVVAITSNMRTILFSGVLLIVFLFLVGVVYGFYSIKKYLKPKKIGLAIIVFLLASGPLVDLAYTMVIVRQDRVEMSASDFLEKTISVYQDKERINKAKQIGSSIINKSAFKINTWNEEYLNNIVLNRFVNLKISDNCLYHARNVGYNNPQMQEELFNQIVAFTPNILLNVFNVDSSKKLETSSYSITDYLYSLSISDPNVRGSAIIGSIPGLGMAFFGFWYLVIIIPIFIIIFFMFDSFVKIHKGKIIFSYFFFVMLLMIANYFNDRHVFVFEIRYIFRTYAENIIIFIIIMKFVRIIESVFFKHNKLKYQKI